MSLPPLFVFGSLMDYDVMVLVTGMSPGSLRISHAAVSGYKQREVRHEHYPVLMTDQQSQVHGYLIHGLTDTAIERILFFEGDEYSLKRLVVSSADGELIDARYFAHTDMLDVLPTAWNFTHWQQQHKSQFLKQTADYMTLFGTMSASDADKTWQTWDEEP